MRTARRGGRLATKLFAAQSLVVLSGGLTLVLVAVVVAPGLFRDHVHRAIGPVSDLMADHLGQAMARALLLSLAIAVAAALLTSLGVSWFITRRLTRPIAHAAAAATSIADGDYQARVPDSRLGVEFAILDNAFNRMAGTLQHTQRRRRELLADLAHELRTPVATLDSFLEGVEDGVIAPCPDTWRTMREQTARLRRLIDDVDSVSRAEEGQLDLRPETLAIDDVLADAVRAAATAFAGAGVTLQRRQSPTPQIVRADPDRIHEILNNLLNNALRHTTRGGTVTVGSSAGRGEVHVTVTDSGIGIAAEHLPHLFDRFYRVDPARARSTGGGGIGLSIARALARAHGGDLRAASDGPNRGATFTLILPTIWGEGTPTLFRSARGVAAQSQRWSGGGCR
jgi:two-component system sensor histidine kinase BaeS